MSIQSIETRVRVSYQNTSGGFWGLIDEAGKRYRPAQLPTELQVEGLRLAVLLKPQAQGASIFMWGQAVELLSFQKL